jgi:hypothetical protein
MGEKQKRNLQLVAWILLLLAVFVSFLVVLQFQKNQTMKMNEGPAVVSSGEDLKNLLDSSKINVTRGLHIFLVIGGIFSLAGILYLFYWVFSIRNTNTGEVFENEFKIRN